MTQHRPERVADRIRQVLARLLQERVRDPRIGFVTLTDVRVSPDLRHARVYVSIMDDDPEPSFRALIRALPFFRQALAREAGLRYTPSLRFVMDDSVAGGFRIERLLDDAGVDRPVAEPPHEDDEG